MVGKKGIGIEAKVRVEPRLVETTWVIPPMEEHDSTDMQDLRHMKDLRSNADGRVHLQRRPSDASSHQPGD